MNLTAQLFAGLGLFFAGIRLVGSHVRQLAAGKVRLFLQLALARPGIGPLAGLLSGALTQSTSAVNFIVTGLIAAGSLDLRRGLVILASAGIGTAGLVFVATINLQSAMLFAFGWLGLAFHAGLAQSDRYRHALLALFGLAILMFGLGWMKSSIALLREDPWTQDVLISAGSIPALEFLCGFALALVTQSASVVAILTLPLLEQNTLQLPDTVMMLYGAGLGAAASIVVASASLEGSARQLALGLALLRAVVALLLVGALLAEQTFGTPLLLRMVASTGLSAGMQCSLHFLLFHAVGTLIAVLMPKPFVALAQRLSPLSAAESAFKPHYVYEGAAGDTGTACELSRLEFVRLVQHLPETLNELRPLDERQALTLARAQRHAAQHAIAEAILQLLARTVRECPEGDMEPVFAARSRTLALIELQEALEAFAGPLETLDRAEWPAFLHGLVEGLHAVLSELATAWQHGDDTLWRLVMTLTEDRGALMERLRRELLSGNLGIAGRESMLCALLAFERTLWSIRRLPPPV